MIRTNKFTIIEYRICYKLEPKSENRSESERVSECLCLCEVINYFDVKLTIGDSLITWCSNKQDMVALSSCEA